MGLSVGTVAERRGEEDLGSGSVRPMLVSMHAF